ncbi:hypothetical protein J3R82DRAFT_11975 [Butyriboletus roseoflavus]|nr:hypothetical protein J3R82DRAFT_11975 [Butyriboletus roseoflavus]
MGIKFSYTTSFTNAMTSHNAVLAHALNTPGVEKLRNKRIVLASASPRRSEILRTLGLAPEIVPSTFTEDLPLSSFDQIHEYPVATATTKAVEVYTRLVRENPDDPPDLVIGADTVVFTHALPSTTLEMELGTRQELLEKPSSKADHLRMLQDLNGNVCEVVTGVSLVYPVLTTPGYVTREMDERTLVHFVDNSVRILEAYVENGEGFDRAGGFAVQGLGSILIRKIDGDYNNVVGFPGASFFQFIDTLVEEEVDFLQVLVVELLCVDNCAALTNQAGAALPSWPDGHPTLTFSRPSFAHPKMSAFAALMALSASQTKQAQSAVQTALEQRQRNEELRRKKQEDAERKAREEEAKLRQKRFEDEKKQQALEAKREEEQVRFLAEQTRREEEARNALLYGSKKGKHQQGPRWPTSQSGIKEEVRRRRVGEEEDSRSGSPVIALTREEKRQRRVESEMRRTYQLKRASAGYSKTGRRLPGGAIDAQSAPTSDSGSSAQSVKARLAALPNTLTKLNVNKRDTRTIDEILQDRAKAKTATLDGDDAREFNDWFGKSKKKEPASLPSTQSSATYASAPSSGANSPRPGGTTVNGKTASTPSGIKQSRPTLSTKTSSSTIPKLSVTAAKSSQSKSPVPKSHSAKSGFVSGGNTAPLRSGGVPPKKRPRSPSLSLSPPPSKRRACEPENALGSEIWKLFGKDRSSYIARDVLSDDEDMEADASAVMKEEMRSTRLAKREDEIALEEEKRHEEEKRRRKRERERLGI